MDVYNRWRSGLCKYGFHQSKSANHREETSSWIYVGLKHFSTLVYTLHMWIKRQQAYRSPQAGLAAELKPVFNWQTALNYEIWSAVFTLHLKVTFTYTLLFLICFFFFLHLSSLSCSLTGTSYLYLLHPLWLCSLVCHSGLDIQISLVHRAQFSSSRCLSAPSSLFPPPLVSISVRNCVSLSGPRSMTANGVPRPALCVFAPEGVCPATLTPAPLSPATGTRACSPQLESAAPSVAAMEVRATSGSREHIDFKHSLFRMDFL